MKCWNIASLLFSAYLCSLLTRVSCDEEGMSFENAGGPPSVQGAWLGQDTYAALVMPTGTAYGLTEQLLNGTVMSRVGINRFLSWECTGVKQGQTRVLLEEIAINQYGVVLESERRCDMYTLVGDNNWSVTSGNGLECPDPNANATYVNTRVEGSTAIPVGPQVCTDGSSTQSTGMESVNGPGFTGDLSDFVVGESIGSLVVPPPTNASFPPILANQGAPPEFLGGVYYINNMTVDSMPIVELAYNVDIGSIELTMLNSSFFELSVVVPGTYEEIEDEKFLATYSSTSIFQNGKKSPSTPVCASYDATTPGIVFAESSSTMCPDTAGILEVQVGTVSVL